MPKDSQPKMYVKDATRESKETKHKTNNKNNSSNKDNKGNQSKSQYKKKGVNSRKKKIHSSDDDSDGDNDDMSTIYSTDDDEDIDNFYDDDNESLVRKKYVTRSCRQLSPKKKEQVYYDDSYSESDSNSNSDSDYHECDDYDHDEDEEEDEDEDEYIEQENKLKSKINNKRKNNNNQKKQTEKFNIILVTGGASKKRDDYDTEEEECWETTSEVMTENEDDPISSSESESEKEEKPKRRPFVSKRFKKELKEEKKKEPELEKETKKIKTTNKGNKVKKEKDLNVTLEDNGLPIQDMETEIRESLQLLHSKYEGNEMLYDFLKTCNQKIEKDKKKKEKKLKKEKDRNVRILKRVLRDKNTMNDIEFYSKIDVEHQNKIIKELKEINKITRIEKPYRLSILESNIPKIYKATAMKKIEVLRTMEPGSGEYYKIKNWVDTFMRIPFDKFETLPISLKEDGLDKCHAFMENARNTLNNAVYGLDDAKIQIMQILGQLITNPKAIGSAFAIHGPPGTGKTSLVKDGISKILNRPFEFIALGGATDSSFLEGHGYTYEGSTWGKIVQILIDCKCMNPVIYFDELDKISDTPKGEEIVGILTHLTDTTQNSQFHDKYFTEIDFDLSKCIFIFSYNDESKINPILKDRMYRIQTSGYNLKQKTIISNNYLLPRLREQVIFEKEDIILSDDAVHYIIENFCNKEDGVRNLKRCLETIYRKLNLYRLIRPDTNLFGEDMSLKVVFPFDVTRSVVDKLLKKSEQNQSYYSMYN